MRTFPWTLIPLLGLALLTQAGFAASAEKAVEPKWLVGKPVNEWFPIPNTKGAGGAPVGDYSGMAIKPATCEIIIAAAGGHGGSRDNRVVSIDLRADAPAWIQRNPPSPTAPDDVPYNPDGKPASRHSYQSTLYVPALDRVMLVGCRFTAPNAHQFPKMDGFDLAKNTWDPAGTWPDVPNGQGFGVVLNPLTGDIYTQTLAKWDPKTKAWSNPITKQAPAGVRFPFAFDTRRNQIFGLNFGDGQGYGDPKITAIRAPVSGNESFQVTIKASDALQQFIKDAPTYCGMDYDPDNDRFLYYCGQGAGAGRIFVITPNDTNEWDMSLYAFGKGSTPPPAVAGAGINNRFRYFAQLKGFVLLGNPGDDMYFIKTTDGAKRK